MKVVLISGHAQNGKDTCAKILDGMLTRNGYKVLVCHYGDLVKYVCTTFFWLERYEGCFGSVPSPACRHGCDPSTERNYWVDFIVDMLHFFGEEWDYVLIPDTRFPNEVSRIREEFPSVHLRVERNHFKSPLTALQQNHPSETALDDCVPDVLIHNDGSLEQLHEQIKNIIWEVL